jgi:hypothetical protein
MREDEIRELLQEMGEEPVPPDSLRRVRLAVAERTERRGRAWWWSAMALAAAACVVLLIVWLRPPAPVSRPDAPVVAREQAAPQDAAPAPVAAHEAAPQRVPVRRRAQPIDRRPPAVADVVIRIETPDPDVVILLIGD